MDQRSEAQIYYVSGLLFSGVGAAAPGGSGLGCSRQPLPALGTVPSDRRVSSPSSGHLPQVAGVI